ncbi:hypothetical protein [Paenibacillus qinlingensis]|uniref:hypothetical protein n=1 Tax=Paenibacillus qinlingensis TaxID=1837343 RepID=UPI0015646518|nr:hypothetical protein [Paenibacillus qinlingensis]
MLHVTSFAAAPAEAGVYFINLGEKGNATLIKTISGTRTSHGLVDTGTSGDYTTYVAPYLSSVLGSTKLSFIAFSHMHGIMQVVPKLQSLVLGMPTRYSI